MLTVIEGPVMVDSVSTLEVLSLSKRLSRKAGFSLCKHPLPVQEEGKEIL